MSKLFRNHNFLRLWVAQIASTLGMELFNLGVMVTIFEQTGSTLQTMGVMIGRSLAAFLLSPIAGILVDRYPRQKVMGLMGISRALLVGSVLFLLKPEGVNVVNIYLLLAGISAADTLYRPAALAIIPSIVNKDKLVKANSLIMSTNQVTAALTYAIGGVMVIQLGLRTIVWINVGAFLLGAILVLSLVVPKREKTKTDEAKVPAFQSFLDGLRYAGKHPVARPLIIMETLEHLPHGIWTGAVLLAFTMRALNGGTEAWGYQISAWWGGQILGAALAIYFANVMSRRPGWVIIGNAFANGVMTFLYAISPSVPYALILAFFFGPPFALRDVAQDSLLQGTVKADKLGRVYATREMLRSIVFMVAGLFFAWLSDQISVRTVFMIGGILYLGTAVYALLSAGIRQSSLEKVPAA